MERKLLDASWKELSGNFKLKCLIGEGSFGTVVKAKHRKTDQYVAIKKIPCDFNDMQSTKYLLREITILRQFTQQDECTFTPKLF